MWTPETQTSIDRLGRCHAEGGRLHPQGRPEDQTHRRRIRLPALRCLDRAARRVSGCGLGRCAVRAGAPAREKIRRRTGETEDRVGSGARLDAGGDRQPRPGRDQGRRGRGAAPRGNQSRADLRILPDHLRHQPQPRALRAEVGEGRHHVDRLRRQLPRLYRRYLPHGDPGRARRRARRFAGRDRKHPARGHEADPRRRDGARRSTPPPSRCARSRSTTITSNSSPTAWAWSATRRRGSPIAGRCLIRRPTPTFRWKPARWCRWKPRCCIRRAASSSSRTPWSSPTPATRSMAKAARGWNRAGDARTGSD